MTLSPGSRLGPYEILAPLGAGGKGKVYKARDTRLERMVVIKSLRQHLSASPEVRQRFEREAKDYDVSPDGQRFLIRVDLISRDTMPMTVALGWAAGIAR